MRDVATFRQALERPLEVPINESETLAIRWSPARLNEDLWDKMMSYSAKVSTARDDGSALENLVSPFDYAREVVAPLMTWWDLGEGGEMYAITPEHVAEFGAEFVVVLAEAIQQDFRIGKNVKKISAGG